MEDPTSAHGGTWLRGALAIAVLAAAGTATFLLARVDAGLGAPTGPDRLLQRLERKSTVESHDTALALAVLRDRPIEGSAFRILGLAADASGDADSAGHFHAIAARLNPRDPGARIQLIERAFAKGQLAEGMEHMDALLRVAPSAGEPLLQRVLQAPGDPRVRNALVERMTLDPPWRNLVAGALATAPDAASAEALLALQATKMAPSPAEVAVRVALLEGMGRPLEARSAWSASLPREMQEHDGLVFDGGFEHGEGPEPYGWRLPSPPGAAVGLDETHPAAGRSALALVFDGRAVDVAGISQDLVLPPGQYRFQLQADLALVPGERPFSWVLACRGSGGELGRLELPATSDGWRGFSIRLEVPASCPRQRLALVHDGRSVGERRHSGRMAFDSVELRLQPW